MKKYTAKEIFSVPNLCGYARVLLLPLIAWLYLSVNTVAGYTAAGCLFLVSALLDFADGQIARRFDMVTDLGKMLDPVADKLTQAVVAVCLATRYPMMLPLLILMVIKETYMGIHGLRHLVAGGVVYGASLWGKGCTALLFLTFCLLILLPGMPLLWANLLILLSMIGMLVTLFLYIRYFRRETGRQYKIARSVRNVILILLTAILAELLYVIVGAVSPFVLQKGISDEVAASFSAQEVLAPNDAGEYVMLVEQNEQALRERIRLLRSAKERIVIATFDIRDGKAIRDMAAVLLERADAGVHVMLLVDAFNLELHMGDSTVLDALTSHENIEMRLYNRVNPLTPWTSQGRMHDKYVMIDDEMYLLGGRNTFDYFLTNDTENGSFDREVLVVSGKKSSDASINQLNAYFESIWMSDTATSYHDDVSLAISDDVVAARDMLRKRLLVMQEGEYADCFAQPVDIARMYPADRITLLHNPTHIYGKEPVLFYELTELMKEAHSRVVIHTPYAVLNGFMLNRLHAVTDSLSGIPVSMMLNGIENGDNFVASSDYLYNRSRVLDTGIRLLEYQGGTSYHGKTVLIDDDISIVGSFNFDMRSTYIDTELMLVIRCSPLNKELSASLSAYEAYACEQLPDGGQSVPTCVSVPTLTYGEQLLYQFFGLFLQPFRFLV